MTSEPFVSFAQNAEDVVLWRALKGIDRGRYLEIGANHPTEDSISRPFYDRGWAGITVEPMAGLVDAHRTSRPRDRQVHAVAGRPGVEETVLHEFPGTGLSTTVDRFRDIHERSGFMGGDVSVRSLTVDQILEEAGFEGDLHFVVIDTEGAEGDVLAGFDLNRWRPWILVVEATVPNSTEQTHEEWEPGILASGYEFCLFDGLSRFYVAREHTADLRAVLSAPANVLDNYIRVEHEHVRQVAARLTDEVVRWRAAALTRWAEASTVDPSTAADTAVVEALNKELDAIHHTVSWRVTAPLRAARRLLPS